MLFSALSPGTPTRPLERPPNPFYPPLKPPTAVSAALPPPKRPKFIDLTPRPCHAALSIQMDARKMEQQDLQVWAFHMPL